MIGTHPKSIDAFRTATAGRAPLVLRPKRCRCHAAVTAKQLAQYGMCEKCRAGK
jgi:hypothetical protein